ncbi:hypothetical protein [Streptomyces cinereoruber]|uniref:hypothetical protein n=1 Tax=Streptomyces cinereoruber TaxID=67260 RepID=UPI003659E491
MDELEACIADLLKRFPGRTVLAVTETAERAAKLQLRFASTPVRAVKVGTSLLGGRFDSVVTDVKASAESWEWAMDVLPTRLAPGAVVYRVGDAV